MYSESSSFDNNIYFTPFENSLNKPIYVNRNGATSDCFKVRIHGKWHFIKKPKKDYATNPLYIAAFEKEFDIGYSLEHPNIVRYVSKNSDNDGIFITTEYVDGVTLREFRMQRPDFFKKKDNIKKILLQLLSALDYMHNRQIVHLDLKPDNILITNNGNNVKLIDLGLSYSDCYNEIIGGTQFFGSPEQFSKPSEIDYRSDLFAFGKIVIYLFSGNIKENSIKHLPNKYKKIVKRCLIHDIVNRNITAFECIQLISKSNIYNTIFVWGSIVLASGLTFILLTKQKTVTPYEIMQIQKKDSTQTRTVEKFHKVDSSKQIEIPKSKWKGTNQSIAILAKPEINNHRKNEVSNDSIQLIDTKTTNNGINDSIESIIRETVKNRLIPNIPALEKTYSNINEYNSAALKKAFESWKNTCDEDCKYLYSSYRQKISFDKFKSIYYSELNKINLPIQKRLDKY